MKINLHPDYHDLLKMRLVSINDPEAAAEFERLRAYLATFNPPDGMVIENRQIRSRFDDHHITVRTYRMENTPTRSPMILNIHGGGFVAGTLDNDNKRCAYITSHTPCVVVSVDYRLAPACVFPGQLEDCHSALMWMLENADELGGDPECFGIQGISAGGNLASGLSLYLRDQGCPRAAMVMLNVPALGLEHTFSREQTRDGAPVLDGSEMYENPALYLGGFNGSQPSYYAFPLTCPFVHNLPPHMIICAEYDPLRDEGVKYAQRLMIEAVPTELHVLPRVPHGYDMVMDAKMTQWIYDGICCSYHREFDRVKGENTLVKGYLGASDI